MARDGEDRLPRFMALGYIVLVVYASLHPFVGWQDKGAVMLDFLFAHWPRYTSVFDIAANIVVYVPLGFLLVPALRPPLDRATAVTVALLLAGGLSVSMELLQNFLPSRVPSNLDLGCNCFGALLGVVAGGRWGHALRDGGLLHRRRELLLLPGKEADLGLMLLGLWLLTQLNPEIMLFGNGDLRSLFDLEAPFPYSAEAIQAIELAVTASSMVGVGVIFWGQLRAPSPVFVVGFFLVALAIKATAMAVLIDPGHIGHWITPGNLAGIACGAVALFVGIVLPRTMQQMVASLALLVATALANLAPENPYLAASLHVWHQGHFLNFNGLTRLTSALWPFLAMAFVIVSGAQRESAR
jgi:VanZ family protein